MEKKKGRKKKIRFNYFLKRKIIIGICLFLVFVGGIVTVFAITNNDDKELDNQLGQEIEKVIPAECPYTLGELEEAITSGWLFNKYALRDYGEEADDMAFVLFHFYEYFSKETKFTVWDEFNAKTGEVLSYKKISYDEYMKYRDTYLSMANEHYEEGIGFTYINWLRTMMYSYVKFV